MTSVPDPETPRRPSRLAWCVDASVAAGAVTTGALLAFGRSRDGAWAGFRRVGEVVAGSPELGALATTGLGVLVHWGQMVALGASTALLLGGSRIASRLRAALLVVLAWEMLARVPWIAVLRADYAAGLAPAPRIGLAALLALTLALAPRRN